MSDWPILHLVTDDRREVAFVILACTPDEIPSFLRIVTDPLEIQRLPRGAMVQGRWYSGFPSLASIALQDRRRLGDLVGPSSEYWDWLMGWVQKRDADLLAAAVAACGGPASVEPPAPVAQIPEQQIPKTRWT